MERFSFVFLVAGLGFFILAFAVSAYLPMIPMQGIKIQSMEELTAKPPLDFLEMKEQYPDAYKKAFGDKGDSEALAEALELGREVYVGEGCWHCHSQQVRPVGGDEARFGRISYPEEYNNALNYPPLWGTRRVGPDLIRQAGVHSNDWHVAHFWNPPDVSPTSVMPKYPWFFESDGKTPNKKGLSIIAYVQWLGSYQKNIKETVHGVGEIDRSYPAPALTTAAPSKTGETGKPATPEKPATPDKDSKEFE